MMGNRSESFTKTKRLWLSVVLVLAVVLASLALVTATAQAGSFGDTPPKAVLMKGATVLQTGRAGSSCWTSYDEGSGNWVSLCVDTIYTFPHADDLLRAGTKLHIRLNKPQRPESFVVTAYEGFDREQMVPIGEGRRLATNLRRVERDGKTVGWDVFFRVNQPDRHYYLAPGGTWKRVPGTHISYGDGTWFFHVKTR
jgi:hypothetical protein